MFENITVISTGDKITKTNKPYKQLTVRQENGTENKVNIWSDFPNFSNIGVGTVIRGKLEQNGQYWNLISELQANKPTGHSGAFKQLQIEKVMDKKNESISKFADNKEYAIKLASTIRMAVDLALSETPEQQETTLQETIRKWRKWLWQEWDLDPKSVDPF